MPKTSRAAALRTLPLLALLAARAAAQPAPEARPTRPSTGSVVPPAPSLLRGTSVASTPDGWRQAPRHRLVLNNLLVLRLNPPGLEDQMRFGYQLRLLERPSRLLRDNFVFLGIAPRINPAFLKIGPSFELQPVSFFNLRLAAEYMRFFGSFGFLQSYASPHENYSDRTQLVGQDGGQAYATHGAHVMIEPLLQFRVGPIALRNKLAIEYWYMDVKERPDGRRDTTFYEATLDTLVPTNGWIVANDLDLLYISRLGVTAGIRYSMVQPLYAESDFRAGEEVQARMNGHHRLGPILAYTFFDRGFTGFNKPTLLLIVNWYVSHRWRTGNDTGDDSAVLPRVFVNSSAMPYLVLGFAFQSDLLPGQLTR